MTKSQQRPKVLIAAGTGHITEVEMIKGLRREGIDIHAAFASTSPYLEALKKGGVPTRTLDLNSNADFARAMRIRGWIKKERFAIVHGLANAQVANIIWASYGLSNKVIAYRGAVGHVSRWDPTCYLKWLNPRIDKIVCVAKAVELDLATNGVHPSKLITIYKGHDLSWYQHLNRDAAKAEVRSEFALPSNAVLIGMAANMRRVKGADLLLRALIDLPSNIHGLFIGEIRDPEIMELAADARLTGRVHFTGYRPDAPYLIGSLDVNVAPSRGREGLTKTIIEGLVQGVPAVVSNAGGLPELVQSGETGYVFEVDNINQLIDKLKILIFDPEKREIMKNNTRKSITEKINICDTIRDTSMLYHSLIT